jgi:hypothetical protein
VEGLEDWLHFIHFPSFESRWREVGFGDDDLRALEILIMAAPTKAPVVVGTGGVRKIRFARKDGNKGKSAGARIGYVFVPEFDAVGLVVVYTKQQQGNITAEQKKKIREYIRRFKGWLAETEGKRQEG